MLGADLRFPEKDFLFVVGEGVAAAHAVTMLGLDEDRELFDDDDAAAAIAIESIDLEPAVLKSPMFFFISDDDDNDEDEVAVAACSLPMSFPLFELVAAEAASFAAEFRCDRLDEEEIEVVAEEPLFRLLEDTTKDLLLATCADSGSWCASSTTVVERLDLCLVKTMAPSSKAGLLLLECELEKEFGVADGSGLSIAEA